MTPEEEVEMLVNDLENRIDRLKNNVESMIVMGALTDDYIDGIIERYNKIKRETLAEISDIRVSVKFRKSVKKQLDFFRDNFAQFLDNLPPQY